MQENIFEEVYGGNLFATEKAIKSLCNKSTNVLRTYGSEMYIKKEAMGKRLVKKTEKKIDFYLEDLFDNILIELQKRFTTD